jgi:hypothetical protein
VRQKNSTNFKQKSRLIPQGKRITGGTKQNFLSMRATFFCRTLYNLIYNISNLSFLVAAAFCLQKITYRQLSRPVVRVLCEMVRTQFVGLRLVTWCPWNI